MRHDMFEFLLPGALTFDITEWGFGPFPGLLPAVWDSFLGSTEGHCKIGWCGTGEL